MSDKLRESVSALIDGEADELELRRLLAADGFEPVRQTWTDFHRARGALSGVDAAIAQLDVSGRVFAALQDDEVQVAATPRWWRPVASVAVAASMAAVVAVGLRGAPGSGVMPDSTAGVVVAAVEARPETAAANASPAGFANAGRVFAPVPLRGSTVSANYGSLPASVPPAAYSNAEARAEAEALMRRRLQQYLLMQAENSSTSVTVAPR